MDVSLPWPISTYEDSAYPLKAVADHHILHFIIMSKKRSKRQKNRSEKNRQTPERKNPAQLPDGTYDPTQDPNRARGLARDRIDEICKDIHDHIKDPKYIHSLFEKNSTLQGNERGLARMVVFGEMEKLKNAGTENPDGPLVADTVLIRIDGERASPSQNKEHRKAFNKMKPYFFQYLARYEQPQLKAAGIDENGLDRLTKGFSPDPSKWMVSHVQACAFSNSITEDEFFNPRRYTLREQATEHASNDLGVDDPWLKLSPGKKASILTIASDGSESGKKAAEMVSEIKPLLPKMQNDSPQNYKGIGGVLEEYDAWATRGYPNRDQEEVLARPPQKKQTSLATSAGRGHSKGNKSVQYQTSR